MSCLGNILWIILCGIILSICWAIVGLLWCITIIGIPVGVQCFKIAGLSFAPFGRQVNYGGGPASFLLNIIWILLGGFELAAISAMIGCILCVTIIGIPFGIQCLKLAKLAFMPFGTTIS